MLLSTTVSPMILRGRSCSEIIDICANAGFDAMDFSFYPPGWHEAETDTPAFHAELSRIRRMAEDRGLCFNQAHAPFYGKKTYLPDPEGCFQNIARSIRYASILGAKAIVVHPLQHLKYCEPGNPEMLFELNMEYYGRLKAYCEEYGIQIAVENMFQRAGNRRVLRSVCSTPEEFNLYLDNLDPRWFVGCLDIGHAMLTDEPVNFIRKSGKYIRTLHVHDNTGFNDDHLMPYCGIIDWDAVTGALRQIGYTGDFTYETNGFQKTMPRELDQLTHTTLAQVGRHLMEKIQTP